MELPGKILSIKILKILKIDTAKKIDTDRLTDTINQIQKFGDIFWQKKKSSVLQSVCPHENQNFLDISSVPKKWV